MRLNVTSSFLLLLLLSVSSLAQTPDDLRSDWLSKDIEAIQQFLPKLEQTDPTLESLEKLFGREPSEQRELGFGACTFTFSRPGGYTHFAVSGLAFDGRIGYYTITVGSSLSWSKIRNHIIEAWKMNGQFEFKERESGIHYEKEYPTVVAEYKEVVRSQLGDLKTVTVPSRLQDAYKYLISLGKNSVIGTSGCDYGGMVPYGKTAIDQIVKSRRYDLIENILKGYNPGGRMYALLVLLQLQRNGTRLNDEIQNAIGVILDLKIGIDTCSGCVHTYKTAKEIVSELDH